ncbi:Succinate-semialdehyde dehydrogenase GabD [Erysiphe neolycopersici]|uniref:Succinate-semialdehyde dehydrogenase n=1 Tax=Erysiphe neolycopersici TaxID=212602 RepID=A0A420HGC6_9PEZI|nr:Succinate-semialdehyde dehydrogenase GabD [Erysiphe neolycopersici]
MLPKNISHLSPFKFPGIQFLEKNIWRPYCQSGCRMDRSAFKLKDSSLLKTNVAFVNDPSSGELIDKAPEFDRQDTELAIKAASNALSEFRAKTGRERSKILRKWYDLMIIIRVYDGIQVENASDLANIITLENGKPLAEAAGEVKYAANFLEWFSEEAPRAYGDIIPASFAGNMIALVKEPVGVCGLITPWNFPAAMLTRKIGPALASGCTVVAKSPGETPFTALALVELGRRAGIPKGVVNIISALENTSVVGESITTSSTVRKVSFTGSTTVGKILMKQCSSSLKKLSFELGGNAPFIVFDDADVDLAVAGAVSSKFRSSGQTCVCANRIFVHSSIYDKFAIKLAAKVAKFHVGDGFTKGVTHGPLIHNKAVAKVEAHVRDAEIKGAKIIQGGRQMSELGPNFYQPTVITGMSSDMTLASEETFGPVAALFKFDTEALVIRIANSSPVGLAAYIFTKDLQRAMRVSNAMDVGMVGVNTGIISDPASPFGGVKESGFGREGSKYGMEEYQVTKTITYGGIK